MPARLPNGDPRRRERWIGKGSDPNRCERRIRLVEDGRAAVGAEMERALLPLVRDPHVVGVAPAHFHPLVRVPRLHRERAAGLPLAGQAVAHGDPNRFTLDGHAELTAAAGGFAADRHGRCNASIGAVGTTPSTRLASSSSRVTNASPCSLVSATYSAS